MFAAAPSAALGLDETLIRRFDRPGPRYTSYPTADRFRADFCAADYRHHLRRTSSAAEPLSFYVHIPFCDTVCYYCACNKVVTKQHHHAATYLDHLQREIELLDAAIDGRREVVQMHWGGGTPTFLGLAQMRTLWSAIDAAFPLQRGGEFSIELDPRRVDAEAVAALSEIGFRRLSLGVQDFDPAVQRAVNRVQSVEQTAAVVNAARRHGFESVSIDLIYGLPKQNRQSFAASLDHVLALDADRLALYNYAHLPASFKPQRRIAAADLPSADTRLALLGFAIERLGRAGYQYIGMDHFAKPTDALARAQSSGRLQRNFQGYSTHADVDLIGIGVSSISKVGTCYSQNAKDLESYYASLRADQLPVARGLELDADDQLRRSVIQALMCYFELDLNAIEATWQIEFANYFSAELQILRELERADLVTLAPRRLVVNPAGRLLVRAIAMSFDRYLAGTQREYSKLI